jgi:hypothetical protein
MEASVEMQDEEAKVAGENAADQNITTVDEGGKTGGGDDAVEVGATIGEDYETADATEMDSMDEDVCILFYFFIFYSGIDND